MRISEPYYHIVKNFKSKKECDNILSFLDKNPDYIKNGGNIYNRCIIQNYPTGESLIDELFLECSIERLKILEPKCEDYTKLFNDSFLERRYWFRFMHYYDNMNFFPHRDAEGEIMCILYLTQPTKDYEGGLFLVTKENNIENIDEKCNKGDLLIVDAHYFPHEVRVKQIKKGRITFFINFNPGSSKGAEIYKTLEESFK